MKPVFRIGEIISLGGVDGNGKGDGRFKAVITEIDNRGRIRGKITEVEFTSQRVKLEKGKRIILLPESGTLTIGSRKFKSIITRNKEK